MSEKLLSVVCSCYNEASCINAFVDVVVSMPENNRFAKGIYQSMALKPSGFRSRIVSL